MAWLQVFWSDVPLDFHQFHYYASQPFTLQRTEMVWLPAAQPVVVGEFATEGAPASLGLTMSAITDGGFDGGWAWSLRAEDSSSGLDLDELAEWVDANP